MSGDGRGGQGARRVYRGLLRVAPRSLRERHGHEMEELFAERLLEAAGKGREAQLAAWVRAVADIVGARMRGTRHERRAPREPAGTRRTLMNGLEIRFALRSLSRQRLATSLVVGMLALGIASAVAVFSLINGLFLRPFPFPEPERLVYINEKAPRWNLEYVGINYPDFDQWRQEQRVFEELACYDGASFNASDGQNVDRIEGAQVTHGFAAVLGVRPLLGRFFAAEEDRPGGPPVVVLSHGLWRERFGATPDVLGRTLRLDGVSRTIIGVMPPEAEFPNRTRLFVPLAADPSPERGPSYSYQGFGRLKAGVTVAQAEADLLRTQLPIWEGRDKERIVSPFVRPLREELTRNFGPAAGTLAGAVGLLLVVACANVASLMLARALARRRELAIRVAVGASRWRLLGQLLVENVLLAAAGGALGLLAGYWVLQALVAAVPDEVPRWAVFGLDARVAAFSVLVTGVAVVLFGWAPVVHAMRDDVRSPMAGVAGGSTASPRGRRTLRLLMGAEFALASVLLVCGGLLLRAFEQVKKVDPGLEPRGVLTFGVYLPRAGYPDNPKRLAFWESYLDKLRGLPGVDAVGAISCAPLGGCHWGRLFEGEGQPARGPNEKNPVVLNRYASPDYFRALGLRLKAGRVFDDRDGGEGSPRVVVINESFAHEFFPGTSDPVGRRLRESDRKEAKWATVVGVVRDVKHYGLEQPMRPGLYFPLKEFPLDVMTLALKTQGEPTALVAPARALLRELDPDLAAYQVRTMEQALRQSMSARATYSFLLAVFAGLAAMLALGGAYGVTAYLATQRLREFGIRLALGAQKRDIRRGVVRGSLTVVGLGVVLGVAASLGAARALGSLLFGVPPHDLPVLAGAAALLLLTALVASWVPAARAARLDPMTTLRTD